MLGGCSAFEPGAAATAGAKVQVANDLLADALQNEARLADALKTAEQLAAQAGGELGERFESALRTTREALPAAAEKVAAAEAGLLDAEQKFRQAGQGDRWEDTAEGYVGLARGFMVLLPPPWRGAAELAAMAALGGLTWSRNRNRRALERTVASVDATFTTEVVDAALAKPLMAAVQGPQVSGMVDRIRMKLPASTPAPGVATP